MEVTKVRTDEVVRTISSEFNAKTGERHYANEVHFSFANHKDIMAAVAAGRAVDLANLPKQKKKSVLIIGSGPTLDEAMPLMKNWEGDVICSTSQASTLLAWGREPEHIVALDPDSNPDELTADTWEGRKSILHLHPGVMPELVKWWTGPMALFRKLQPQTSFYAREQAMGYSPLGPLRAGRYWGNEAPIGITAQIPMLACVLAAQIAIAKHIGYRQLVLVGADFSFPDDRYRFTPRAWEDGQWVEHKPETLEEHYSQDGADVDPLSETELDGLKSTPMQIFYSHQAVIAWRITECNIVNASPKGLIRMVPHVPIEEVVRRGNKGVKGLNLKQIRLVSEEHLARQNIYIFNVGNGVMPHEFKDPLHEVPRSAERLKEMLTAQGKGEMFDEEANMKRIKKLFKKVLIAP